MFEKLKTPAFLRAAREGLETGKSVSALKVLLSFFIVYMIAGALQSFALTPVVLVLMLTDKEYLGSLVFASELPDQEEMLAFAERLLQTDAVLVATLFATAFLGIAAAFYCRAIEKRSLRSMGIRKTRAVTSSLLAVVLALALLIGAVAFAHFFGASTLVRAERKAPILTLLLFFGLLISAFAEEVLFRGFLMVSLARGRSLGTAMLVSSLIFACFHRAGAGATPVAFLNFFLFGLLASLFMIRFGNLFGAWALHAAWSVAEGLLFGSPVSGNALPVSLLSFANNENAVLINGGTFGLEGGIAVTCVLAVGVAFLGMLPTKEN